MDKTTKYILIGILILVGISYIKNPPLLSFVGFESPVVQYYNRPIEATFTASGNASIEIYFNDQQLPLVNNSKITVTHSGDKYTITVRDINVEGIFKVVVRDGAETKIATVEVKQPYVDTKTDIISLANKGETKVITVQTFNPQGEPIEADSVDIDAVDNDNQVKTLFLTKSGNTFTTNFNYAKSGYYNFKIHARKLGYATIEKGAITNVVKEGRLPTIVWVWAVGLVLIIGLLILKRVRGRSLFR